MHKVWELLFKCRDDDGIEIKVDQRKFYFSFIRHVGRVLRALPRHIVDDVHIAQTSAADICIERFMLKQAHRLT